MEKYFKYFLLYIFLSLPFWGVNAQSILDKTVQLSVRNGSSVELLQLIEKETGISFSYSNKVCLKNNVTLKVTSNTINGFLQEIFSDCLVDIHLKRKKIIITPGKVDVNPKVVLKGYVKSSDTGEILIGSSVYDSGKWIGVTSNNFGFYSLELDTGEVVLNCSYVGFKSVQHRFVLKQDTIINFRMEPNSLLKEIPVVSFLTPEGINSTRNSTISLPVVQIKKVPAFLGEIDVARTLQLLPGINGGSEGVSGLFVRGGGADQNLFLLDDVPVYNISHLFGFFSVFNEDAINNVTVTKGGFPARYGGRLSSVVDIRLKDGNTKKFHGTASAGMMSSKIALDGPLYKDKTTFSVSFRRSYYDLVALLIQAGDNSKTSFYFYDTSTKLSHKFNNNNRLYLAFYTGRDRVYTKYNFAEVRSPSQPAYENEMIDVNDENYSGWGNTVASLRWNKVYNDKLFSNISVSYSDYSYLVGYEEHMVERTNWDYFEQKYYSGITDWMGKLDFDYYLEPRHHIKFGGNITSHKFNPGADIIRESQNSITMVDSTLGKENVFGTELSFYLEDDFKVFHNLKVNAGVYASFYETEGTVYNSWQPRLSLRYLLFPKVALKGSYSKMTQYMHLYSTSAVSLPTDVWIPVTDKIKPQHATQMAFGGKWEFRRGFDMSLMGYLKNYDNLLSVGTGAAAAIYSESWEDNLEYGTGKAKGIEFLVHKKIGKFTGWVGYTFAEAFQKYAILNRGKQFPTVNDRRHDIGVFANYVINPKVDVSATWLYGSGNYVTLPSKKYYSPTLPTVGNGNENHFAEHITSINGYQMPVFHRLDVGINLKKKNKLGERVWSFGLYNTYGRQNAFSLYFKSEEDKKTGDPKRQLKQLSIFPFPLPYVRYTLKF